MQEFVKEVQAALKARGFEVYWAETAAKAREQALALIPKGASVGMGGSMTMRELDMASALTDRGNQIWCHTGAAKSEVAGIWQKAMEADIYLCSSNAVTKDGQIVNIDGNGNRVAGMFFGPRQVILIISQQKLVDGGLNTAIARIKQHACPPNAKRLGLDTPCARTGLCRPSDCGEDCMCRVTTALSHPTRGRSVTVILVGESLGY